MKLLYFSPVSIGGLADYAHEQANALVEAGVDVCMLATPAFFERHRGSYKRIPLLQEPEPAGGGGIAPARRLRNCRCLIRNHAILAQIITKEDITRVLFGCYAEYLAPLWVKPLQRLSCRGVVFGAVVHDPVRDYMLGPLWWHRRSVACAYSFLREAFVHEEILLDTIHPMPNLEVTVIPHGIYSSPQPSGRDLRSEMGIPRDSPVLLAFGHIRDGKNLHLVLRAMADTPAAHLIIAGDVQTLGQKPVAWYQQIAREAGVADRCHWITGYIRTEDVGDLFSVADLVLLTYGGTFRSASGVLNLAAHYRKPCLASAGAGNLKSMVMRYNLGVWVEPDDLTALAAGLALALKNPVSPDWDRYAADNSWIRNAGIVCDRMRINPSRR